jgi:ABC-type antimicrobial peptide transport system permease subunit
VPGSIAEPFFPILYRLSGRLRDQRDNGRREVLEHASRTISAINFYRAFLGLGVRPPTPDWGLMLSTLRQSIYVVPLVCAIPGLAIFITSICCNLVSDGLRAAMDVRM